MSGIFQIITPSINKIDEYVYIGNIKALNLLESLNIKYVISLCKLTDIQLHKLTQLKLHHKYLCIPDNVNFHISDIFSECYTFIMKAIKNNGKILIHCNSGISRSSTISIIYLMAAYKLSLTDAYNKLKSIRACIKPNNGFWNILKKVKINYVESSEHLPSGQIV